MSHANYTHFAGMPRRNPKDIAARSQKANAQKKDAVIAVLKTKRENFVQDPAHARCECTQIDTSELTYVALGGSNLNVRRIL